ncbi:glycosyltransferase [Pontibacter sp. 172403-2]|uniref:glycosyltransferase family 2 protein n=1 Tax=Pontibacter rufus TaxID=2791028 RepID=UPI0018AFABA1|nr:glycosyltransferase [Pontibacter sp. 172403-2]MBF9253913.1 glycosyltransferase [Pontibacter sp. 172403-2]
MKAHAPYLITHIDLSRQQAPPVLDLAENGYYLVFWWKEIALGHVFLPPGRQLTSKQYYSKLAAAIRPAIKFYTKGREAKGDWKQWLPGRDIAAWTTWMADIFTSALPGQLPAKVPVSVIICTRNRADQLQRCLTLLTSTTSQPEQIIVVDNAPAPGDNSTLKVVQQFNSVTYVKEPHLGLDIARNTGILYAKSPIIAYVDDDVVVHPLWLYRVWETFRDPAVAAMTGLVIASELETEAQYIFEKFWSFNRGYADKTYDSKYFKATLAKGPPVWEIGAGANMAFRKDVFEEVGFFNELLDVGAAGCNGDSEMWYRILAAGHTIKYNPRAIVFHQHRKEMKGLKKQIFYYMRGATAAALIQQKQNPKAGYRRYILWLVPVDYGRLIVKGFPGYHSRYSTLWAEIGGLLSGLAFYLRKRKQHPHAIR